MTDHAPTTTSAWTRHARRLRYPYLAAAAAMGMLLLAVSLLPHRAIEHSSYPQVSDLFDAANHFAGFALFNYLLAAAVTGIAAGRRAAVTGNAAGRPAAGHASRETGSRHLLLYLIAALFWGALCECSQLLQATRSFQLLDLGANLLPVPLFVGILRRRTYRERRCS
jgi:hypothetical protein